MPPGNSIRGSGRVRGLGEPLVFPAGITRLLLVPKKKKHVLVITTSNDPLLSDCRRVNIDLWYVDIHIDIAYVDILKLQGQAKWPVGI